MSFVPFDRERFLFTVSSVTSTDAQRCTIGTYKEKTLHRVLKEYFTEDGAVQEHPLDRFVADIYSPKEIIEIQTSGLSSLREKLEAFLEIKPVTLVYPIAKQKWVYHLDAECGAWGKKRKSPKTGQVLDAIPEMVYILPFLHHPNLKIRIVLLHIEEYRVPAKNRRGHERYDRLPTDITDIFDIENSADVREILPTINEEVFSAKSLTAPLRCRGRKASAYIRVLLELGLIQRVEIGKRRYMYRFT